MTIPSPFAHLLDPEAPTPAGAVHPPASAAPVHLPTAFLPDDDPAAGESCRECGEWWPCAGVFEDAAWRGHSHGSERKCDTECWSRSATPIPTRFHVAPDAYDDTVIWAVDEGPDRHVLGRASLGPGEDADALWRLIVVAVEGAAS